MCCILTDCICLQLVTHTPSYSYFQYALLYDDIDNGGRAVWDDSEEKWKIPGLTYDGDNGQPKDRSMTKQSLRRPESEYARQRKLDNPNPRWHSEDIVELDLVMPTRSNNGNAANTTSNIQAILAMDVNANPSKTARRLKHREEKYFTATDKKKKSSSRRKTKSPKSSFH